MRRRGRGATEDSVPERAARWRGGGGSGLAAGAEMRGGCAEGHPAPADYVAVTTIRNSCQLLFVHAAT